MFKQLNTMLQKVSTISKEVSDLNSIEQLLKGNPTPIKRKVRNKIKNSMFNKIWDDQKAGFGI